MHVARGLTPAQARAYRLMDNRSSENAEWDAALLGLELDDLQLDGFDLSLTGFDDDELARLLCQDATGTRDDEDDIPETPEQPVSRRGDLWTLGPHRLLCGDATVERDVERLLAGVRPLLMVTDPPYGVCYDPFIGSGTTLIAAETTARVCLAIELSPAYVDVAVERWQRFTGQAAVLEGSGQPFEAVTAERGISDTQQKGIA